MSAGDGVGFKFAILNFKRIGKNINMINKYNN